jgi:hypothetical protein
LKKSNPKGQINGLTILYRIGMIETVDTTTRGDTRMNALKPVWSVEEGRWVGGEYDLSEAVRNTYYQEAYRTGREAFKRGEEKSACPYTEGLYGRLGVRGWNNGWADEFRAAQEPRWWDDASYLRYQAGE